MCDCQEGLTLFDRRCVITVKGCIVYDDTDDESCIFCNIRELYSLVPDYQGQCSCKISYQLINGSCTEICGDGLLMNTTSSSLCDDGNMVDGDGCSSTCKVEVKYRCENGSDSSPSACFYCGMIRLTLNKTERVDA